MARCSSTSSEEYLCAVFYEDGYQRDYGIYRWNLTGLHSDDYEPHATYFRLPAVDKDLSVGAFASVGSKIYMIGGKYKGSGPSRCSTDIFLVDTEKLHTRDPAQIVEKLPSVLQSLLSVRDAVAVGGKIYTFPGYFRYAEDFSPSRFEVFDPVARTSRLLPEPDLREYGIDDYYTVFKTHILLCSDGLYLFDFDTAHENWGWRDLSADFARHSIGIDHKNLLPFSPTLILKGECGTALGDDDDDDDDDASRLFATVSPADRSLYGIDKFGETDRPFHGIVKFGDEPLRIEKWYRIYGIPNRLVEKPCFAHGGSVFFTYIENDRPKSGYRVWIFRKYSLTYHSAEDEDYYSAREDSYFWVKHPCSYDYDSLASFVLQVPSSS